MTSKIEDMLEKYAKAPKEAKKDPKTAWVERMMRSAKKYYKRCPRIFFAVSYVVFF